VKISNQIGDLKMRKFQWYFYFFDISKDGNVKHLNGLVGKHEQEGI
jgi:hypothetical protein